MKIDIHAHLVKDSNGNYLVNELLDDMVKHDINKRVVSIISGSNIKENNKIVSDLSLKYPDKIIGCAYINPKLDTALEDIDDALLLSGIKMIEFNSFNDGYYPDSEPKVSLILEKISKSNLPIKVFVGIGAYSMPHQWEFALKEFSNINIIYLHMACFDYGYSSIDIVSRNKNAYIETSNQYELQIFRKALENLDSTKIVFGSTYPERLTSNAIDIFDLFKISKQDYSNIFENNAKRLLNI